ncbi:hypothetical protein ABZX93_31950 [Streptomyces sp. NPDC006632]|uniref:hypothetical protein n=1 Tax=Streptomyces sp. NPDC006632 TaxID=3157182 RepID=UPI0033AFE903
MARAGAHARRREVPVDTAHAMRLHAADFVSRCASEILAEDPDVVGFPALLAYQLAFGITATVWAISMRTAQQLVAPSHLQGRVAGFTQAALPATVPAGALTAGALAARLGNVPVLTGGATTALLAAACFWLPLRVSSPRRPESAAARSS